ncbi:uncharacterized protein BCR38DRAFT_413057 [Pseudomassariella vexata]|uniref:Tat pathway signal sequence n=1 Tax=Pseudomassariella vexata TaxID=1141098 RepID=A0A1Y2DHN3_9PEZI|nr:uncharacterized protein BCR38DRAFT_413057 [Pseudomassariella vexata]ORY58738.1 hypothetical protein BCR38DRAFT_413057 [Pseudomassariella vexata]
MSGLPPSGSLAPAQDVVRYKETIFGNGFDERSTFQGPPSPAVDHAWMKSYSFLNRVPESQAKLLPDPTVEIKGDPGHYVVTLEIFHSLHCLDELRKLVWPGHYGSFMERYNVSEDTAVEHQDHCVEALREALLCGSDITTHSWKYRPDGLHIVTSGMAKHSCRDFDAVKQWAVDHDMKVPWQPVGLQVHFE